MKVGENAIWRDDGARIRYIRPETLVVGTSGYGLLLTYSDLVHVGRGFRYDESISGGNFVGNTLGGEDIGVGGGANTGGRFDGVDIAYEVGRGQSVKKSLWDESF